MICFSYNPFYIAEPFNIVNEAMSISFPANRGEEKTIARKTGTSLKIKNKPYVYIRTAIDATGGSGFSSNSMYHSCSIKIYLKPVDSPNAPSDFEIHIPTKPYHTKDTEKATKILEDFKETRISKLGNSVDAKFKRAITNFIYDNQMAIIAYWYVEDDKVRMFLEDYLKKQLLGTKYFTEKFQAKDADDLKKNRKDLETALWMDPRGITGKLNFGN